MAWHPECPNSPLPFSSGSIAPHRVVFHRTIGTWPGDYSVLSRGSVPSVHFLVGQAPGQWVQWYSTGQKCAHAAGANDGVGIEISGQNGEALTDWQIEACGKIVRWLISLGIAPTFLDSGPRVNDWQGFGNHSNVVTTPAMTHYDYIDRADFDRMVGAVAPAPIDIEDGDSMVTVYVNPQGTRCYFFVNRNGEFVQKTWNTPVPGQWNTLVIGGSARPAEKVLVDDKLDANLHLFSRSKDGRGMAHATYLNGSWVTQVD